jgi:hypothetical protein
VGHLEKNCWKLHRELNPHRKRGGKSKPRNKKRDESSDSEVLILSPCIPLAELVAACRDAGAGYVVDSGCGVTTLKSANGCSNVRACDNRVVEDAGLKQHRVTHLADLTIAVEDSKGRGYKLTLRDCLVVPTLGLDLVSTDHLNLGGHKVVLGPEEGSNSGKFIKTPDSKRIALVKAGRLPFLPINAPIEAFNYLPEFASGRTVSDFCNACASHEVLMHAGSCAKGKFCKVCAACKQHEVPHPRKAEHSSNKAGGLIWSDVAGPLPPSLFHSNRYAVLFMDDFTEVRFVYFVKRKSDVTAAFRTFCTYFKQWGKVDRIRTDNGGECTAKQFAVVAEDEMVCHEWSCPRTPQQMGKAERSWRTLKEMAMGSSMTRYATNFSNHPLSEWNDEI